MTEIGGILFGIFMVGWFVIGTGIFIWRFMRMLEDSHSQ